MLKTYDPIYSVSIDGNSWKRLGDLFDTNWFVTGKEIPETEILLDNVSFEEAYDYLRDNYISGARTCKSVFKEVPMLSLLYFNARDREYIKKCETFSLRVENELRENVTLDWIMKHLEADTAIQYLAERGMGICSNKKTK